MMSLAPARASSAVATPFSGSTKAAASASGSKLRLGEDALREGFQPLLPGDGCPCPALGTEGEVDVFEDGEGCGGVDFALQFIGEELALGQGLEDRLAPLVEFRELVEAVADRRDRHLVEGARGLFPIAGDEGDRSPLSEEIGRCRDLRLADIEFGGDRDDVALHRIFRWMFCGCVVPVLFGHPPASLLVMNLRPLISQAVALYEMKLCGDEGIMGLIRPAIR